MNIQWNSMDDDDVMPLIPGAKDDEHESGILAVLGRRIRGYVARKTAETVKDGETQEAQRTHRIPNGGQT